MASNKSGMSTKSNFDSLDKVFSSTLKRNPKMELSKTDLLKLLSYLEGELQAREIVIATLKAERVKQLLYQAKYGQFSLNDPFAALQRDSYGAYNPDCDEAAIKAMYNNQLSQVENLILQHQRAQQRLRQHLFDSEQQHAQVVAELEEEIRKHAQDTAQGDDVTYMLEKERERLHQEIELERQQNKKLEKELKKVVQALEQDKVRHKQIVMLLLEDRKRIIARLLDEHGKAEEMARFLSSEKGRMADVVEGLEEESKKSLEMEAELERQAMEFTIEREELRRSLQAALEENRHLHEHTAQLAQELSEMRQQLQPHATYPHRLEDEELDKNNMFSKLTPMDGGVAINGELTSKVMAGRSSKSPSPVPSGAVSPQHSSTLLVGGLGVSSAPLTQSSTIVRTVRSVTPTPPNTTMSGGGANYTTPSEKSAIRSLVTVISGASSPPAAPPTPSPPQVVQMTPRVSVSASPGTRVYTTTQGGKVTFHVTAPPQPPKKPPQLVASTPPGLGVGRGTPPPIPPNKPILAKKDTPQLQFIPHAAAASAAVVASAPASSGSAVPGVAPLKIATTSMPGCGLKFGITISKAGDSGHAAQPPSPHLVMSSTSGGPTSGGATVVAATSVPITTGSTAPDHSPNVQIFKETQQPVYVSAFSPSGAQPLHGHSWDGPLECGRIQYLNLSPRKSWSTSAQILQTPFPRQCPLDDPQDAATDGLAHELADFQQLLVSMATSSTCGSGHTTSVTTVNSTSVMSPEQVDDLPIRSDSPTGRLSVLLERWKMDRKATTINGGGDIENVTAPKITTSSGNIYSYKTTTSDSRMTPMNFSPRVRKVMSPNLPKSFNNIEL